MQFTILPVRTYPPSSARSRAFLVANNWDDFHFKTTFGLHYVDEEGVRYDIGAVKIGRFGMGTGPRPEPPQTFETLPGEFFSLGQDDSYYESLNSLGTEVRDTILSSLHDLASDRELFSRAREEKVTGVSLLRSVSIESVLGQFARLATGGARLTPFRFTYQPPASRGHRSEPPELTFEVKPESEPPTNVHVLIGRNGVGKTRILHFMARALAEASPSEPVGNIRIDEHSGEKPFANLVSVTFSAFDEFEPLRVRRDKTAGLQYSYVGLKKVPRSAEERPAPKSPSMLAREFADSVRICSSGPRAARWRRALEMLEGDPVFRDAEVASLASEDAFTVSIEDIGSGKALALFRKLSSGHKIVLLTITRLVETVEERSLVLIDEPEAHLHPPLLAAFVRSLSDLLINRNGVAIIATHSPVMLQEVPKTCVWKIRRSGNLMSIDRPEIETFGENVGVLTREIFGLEVTQSGFHRLLNEAIGEGGDYADVVRQFQSQLGGEALALIRAMLAQPGRRSP